MDNSDSENNTWSSIELTSENLNDENLNDENLNDENLNDENLNGKNSIIDSEFYALELNYKLNYTTKYLGHILDYYGISKAKLNKDTIIRKLVEFEININNSEIVERRKYLFDNIEELKHDNYFKKFIMWNML